ncbi:beta-L-arabinofuranosidase domain-containing protein [Agreia sp. Leaf283]|uniref:beta-L-arabinofuranosidase domain-containing protein n=1 Tax=Agreia sp. Leaf283 TaxID=1736321 RepID=UPI00070182E3|nr:beta-L-arabinofuranosidase domain-containing protein [Agreia sp. Leaf283]KQP56574.1 hypothetical protein ASF51_01200 [Agreia sp. Leaf283]
MTGVISRTRLRTPLALALSTVLALGLSTGAPQLVAAEPVASGALDAAKVLDLTFDGSLSDSSTRAGNATMQKGTEKYDSGIDGQAFSFDGSNAINLGTDSALQPKDLTVSFWFKPNGAMSGEQVFAWSKTVYNSDGWYLTSEGAGTPLALSIGPSGGQPYKVVVQSPRSDFFPSGAWTHVVASYDSATKKVDFYRNGVRQVATISTPVSSAASGVLGSENTSVKTLGFNGPIYNGGHVAGLVDDYSLYSAVATIDDVVTLTQKNDSAFDPQTIAQAALDAVTVPAQSATSFTLPVEASDGTRFAWSSSNPERISVDGATATVVRGDDAATVVLTASATYGSGAPVSKTFEVVVPTDASAESPFLDATGLDQVLLEDPYLVNGNQKMIDYLLSLDPEKFLNGFYTQAGLPVTADPYGGWERTSGVRFQGHFFGHYISALSQSYSTTTDATTKAALLAKLTTAVSGLKKAQDAYAQVDPANAGYVAPFSVNLLPGGGDGLLVPFYNLHKIEAGLLDAHKYAPADVSADALAVASGFGTWVTNWADRQSNPGALLNTEYGGMNEALYSLYAITEDPTHKRAAEYFDEVTLFQQLAAGQDVLNGKHANTTIPKLIGALKRYTVFTENPNLYATLTETEKANLGMYRTAAENFWQMVVDDHTYANGGNSYSEHFHEADTLYQYGTSGSTTGYGENSTSEGCNEYNMLKLSKALFQVEPDVKYADFYESTYINTILASQNPETGMMTYFQPQAAGYAKVFGRELDEFWCDHGTATESFTKLGDSIYFTKDSTVYVNQFRSSVFTSDAQNLRLRQVADVPSSDTVSLTVESIDGGALRDGTTLKLRVPAWVASTPTLTVNGSPVDVATITSDGYAVLPVSAGDQVSYVIPASVTVDNNTENKDWVAFKYGPVLLATELNRNNVDADYVAGVLVRMSQADKSVSNDIVVPDATAFRDDIAHNLVRLDDGANNNGLTTMRFALQGTDAASAALVFEPYYSLYNARYATYMNLIEPDSAQAQALIRQNKEQLRVDETTIDSLTSFDNNNSEADKNYRFAKSGVGVHLGQGYRDGQRATDAFFQYEMIVDPSLPKNYLGVRYFGGDNGRTFDIYLNDVLLKNERVTNANGSSSWYIQYDEIPASVLASIEAEDSYKRDQSGAYVLDAQGEKIPVVTVRFQGNGSSYVGGVFGVYTASDTSFATESDLAGLSFEGGSLTPQLAGGVYSYRVSVPEGATTATFDADPAVPSGLVFVGDVLIDDSLPRTVALAENGPTTLTLRASAQDHVTMSTYDITITADAAPPVEAAVLELDSTELRAGGSFTLSGTGFDPDEKVTVQLFSEPVTLAEVQSDGAGAFTGTFIVPAEQPVGAHTLRATGERSGIIGEAAVTVLAPTVPDPGTDPGPGPTLPGSGGSPWIVVPPADAAGAGTDDTMLPATGLSVDQNLWGSALLALLAGAALLIPARRRRSARA